MSYIRFKGVSTATLQGVAVSKMPSHARGAMRYTEFYVKGRDGALHIEEGLSNIELPAKLVLLDAGASTRQIVNNWASGSGKLILSDDTTKCYKASVLNEVRWNRVRGNTGYFDTADVVFNCDPYVYEATESVEEFTQNGALTNPGTAKAIPLIKVEGNGNVSFTIGGKSITIRGMASGNPVFLDSETGYVYGNNGAAMEMVGDFPVLGTGNTVVTLGTNCTKLTITPHWRWI